jgi:hypothetical protein
MLGLDASAARAVAIDDAQHTGFAGGLPSPERGMFARARGCILGAVSLVVSARLRRGDGD